MNRRRLIEVLWASVVFMVGVGIVYILAWLMAEPVDLAP